RERPRPVGELVSITGLSQPGTSKHLRVLREAGLVVAHTDAQRRVYALNAAPLVELDAWLEPYRALWDERLDALQRHLDHKSRTPPWEARGACTGHAPPSRTAPRFCSSAGSRIRSLPSGRRSRNPRSSATGFPARSRSTCGSAGR